MADFLWVCGGTYNLRLAMSFGQNTNRGMDTSDEGGQAPKLTCCRRGCWGKFYYFSAQSVGLRGYHHRLAHHEQNIVKTAQLPSFGPEDGGQPGGNGLRHTIGSRHPRRRILDPDQLMKWVGLTGNWTVDQNPTDWYTVGIKKTCDLELHSTYLMITETPLSRQVEVVK
jgi:hypothetical protein